MSNDFRKTVTTLGAVRHDTEKNYKKIASVNIIEA